MTLPFEPELPTAVGCEGLQALEGDVSCAAPATSGRKEKHSCSGYVCEDATRVHWQERAVQGLSLSDERARLHEETIPTPTQVTLNGDWAETMFYNLLSGKLPIRTPRIFFSDMNRRTTNFIWIMERVPYGFLAQVL